MGGRLLRRVTSLGAALFWLTATLDATDAVALRPPTVAREATAATPVSPDGSVTPLQPRILNVNRLGNCEGPPSPGETVDVEARLFHVLPERTTVRWGLKVSSSPPGPIPWLTPSRTRRTIIERGAGFIERSDRLTVRPAGRALAAPLRLATWGAIANRPPSIGAALTIDLGTTLAIRTLDSAGKDVASGVAVTNAGCRRTRGATWRREGHAVAAFFHVDPTAAATIEVTAGGYFPATLTLQPQELQAGRIKHPVIVLTRAADMAKLEATVAPLVSGWRGDNAVTITDLQTGRTVSVNGARPQLAACTIKVFIMLAVAQDIGDGRYTAASIDWLVRSAMGPSATPPARELIRLAGGGDVGTGVHRINQIMWDLGMSNSILTHPPGYTWEEYGYLETKGIRDNLLTTDDLNLALGKLYRREALSSSATDYVLWSMTLATPFLNGSLGGPLPDEADLYHKIGLIGSPQNTWNDAGVVVFERGGRQYAYAISYMGSYGGSYYEAYLHGYQLSSIAWSFFSDAYRGQ